MELRRFRDEAGGLLLDLPAQAAPERLHQGAGALPPDLGRHAARARAPHRHPPGALPAAGVQHQDAAVGADTFTVDGQVAGTWREEKGKVLVKPFEPLPKAARREVDEEAARLARFIAEGGTMRS